MDTDNSDTTKPTFAVKVHDKFGPGNGADLVIQSSDDVQFCVHSQNLESAAGAFPGVSATAKTSRPRNVVHLAEDADVLEILFEFAYPWRHPRIENFGAYKVARIAEAAEKYDFYSAAPMCQILLWQEFHAYGPLEMFRHAITVGYPDAFIDKAAIGVCPIPISFFYDFRTHGSVANAWTRYYQGWQNIFKQACQRYLLENRELIIKDREFADEDEDNDDSEDEDEELSPDDYKFIKISELYPCDRCYSSLVAWVYQISIIGSLGAIKDELEKDPSLQACTAELKACSCPPPFDIDLKKNKLHYDKDKQIRELVATIASECSDGIDTMESFASLMRRLSD